MGKVDEGVFDLGKANEGAAIFNASALVQGRSYGKVSTHVIVVQATHAG